MPTLRENLIHSFSHLGRVPHDLDAVALEAGDLRCSIALATSNNGAGVAHPAAGRCSLSGNETHDGQIPVIMGRQPLGSFLFSTSADLTNHDDALRLRVVHELFQHIDEVGSVEGITANADDGRLTEVVLGRLVDGLVSEGS